MTSRNSLTVTLSALLVAWSTALPVKAQNIQSPFGSRPFAPSGPQGSGSIPPGGQPLTLPEIKQRDADNQREPLLADIAHWIEWSIAPSLALDHAHCNFGTASYEQLKAYHDTVQQFVRGDGVPANMVRVANEKGYAAARSTMTASRAISAADQAACRRGQEAWCRHACTFTDPDGVRICTDCRHNLGQ